MNRESLNHSIRPLLRWWWLIVAAALVAGVTCLVYVRMRPDIYASHASLMVGSALRNPNPDSTQFQLGAYLARSYASMAGRSTVQDAVKAALDMQWLPEYSVRTDPDSPLIEVMVIDSDPQRAQVVASELVRQIVLLSPGGAAAENRNRFAQNQLNKMESDISATETRIGERQEQLAKATSAKLILSLQGEVTALEAKLGGLRDSYTALLSSTREGAVNAVSIVEAPSFPTLPESTGGLKLVLLATVMGGILAAAGAYLLDFLDDSVTQQQQVEETLQLPTLGTIPTLGVGDKEADPARALVMHSDPHAVAAEAFRVLRTNILFAAVDAPLHRILITSSGPHEGKSTIAANLAIAMAQSGRRVILVDGDLRRPVQHRLFGLRNNAGLSSALVGDERTLAAAIQKTSIPGLSVLTTGPLPPNPAELLGSRRMSELLESLRDLSDLLVVDTPPVNAVTDAAVLAARSDATLLVLRAGRSGRRQAQYAVASLRNAHARVLGAVLNGVSRSAYGYPYYHATERYGVYGAEHHSAQQQGVESPSAAPQPTRLANTFTRGRSRTAPPSDPGRGGSSGSTT